MPVLARVFSEIVIGTTAHTHDIVLLDTTPGESFGKKSAQEQGHVTKLLQHNAALPLATGLFCIAVKKRKRSECIATILIQEKSLTAAEPVKKTGQVPAGIFMGWRFVALSAFAHAIFEVNG